MDQPEALAMTGPVQMSKYYRLEQETQKKHVLIL